MLLITSLIISAAMGVTALVIAEGESKRKRLLRRRKSQALGFAVL